MSSMNFENVKYTRGNAKILVNIPNEEELKGILNNQDKITVKQFENDIVLNIQRRLYGDAIENFEINCMFSVKIDNKEKLNKKEIINAIKNKEFNNIITDTYADISLIIATITKCTYFGTIVTIPTTIYDELIIE